MLKNGEKLKKKPYLWDKIGIYKHGISARNYFLKRLIDLYLQKLKIYLGKLKLKVNEQKGKYTNQR